MIRKRYVDGRWGQVHVREAGDGVPLLLLHQSPLSGMMFDAAMPHLAAAGLRAVAIDTPGFGNSDPPPGPVEIAGYADALAPVLDAFGWGGAAILGHHTGAAIAASFAARHPGRAERLILNGVPLFTPDELAFFRTFDFGPIEPRPDGSHLTAAWAQRLTATPGWTDIEAMHRYVIEMLRHHRSYWWGFKAALGYDIAPDLAAIGCPTMVLTNSGEDLYEASRRAAERHPHFAFAALDGGTHDIVDEQPEAWARIVARFTLASG
jgi:pimeloyl-ACP methyl ester carboxylesterase